MFSGGAGLTERKRSRSDASSKGTQNWAVWAGVLLVGVVVGLMAYHALSPLEDTVGGGDLVRVDSIHHEQQTHVHGIGYDERSDRLFVATHHGLFRLDNASGEADRLYQVGEFRYDLMGYSLDVTDGDRMFASGHPGPGRNMGVMRSEDGGFVWERVWDGPAGRNVDFHSMALSPADPYRLVGFWGGMLHLSLDGGESWMSKSGGASSGSCWGAPCLGWDDEDPDVLWMGSGGGLQRSGDLGDTWEDVTEGSFAAVYPHPSGDGIWAWVQGDGVVRSFDAGGNWTRATGQPGDAGEVFQFSGGPGSGDVVFAATMSGQVFRTLDGGGSWQPLDLV